MRGINFPLSKFGLAFFGMLALSSCSSSDLVTQRLDAEIYYRRDLPFSINGKDFPGVALPALAEKYVIEVKPITNVSTIIFKTCHREIPVEFSTSTKDPISWTYTPVKGIEDQEGCPLEIGAYEKEKGATGSWGYAQFPNASNKLAAKVLCDGKSWDRTGESLCHAHEAAIQKITFPQRAKKAREEKLDEECRGALSTADELTYTLVMPAGECTYYFGTKEGETHRLVTLGYSGILVRQ